MIATLKEQHDGLRAIADRLDVYLGRTDAPTDPEFPRLRWMLIRELSLHLATERQMLNDWQARSGRRLEQFDCNLDAAFADHVATWGGAMIAPAWHRYRAATKTLLSRLRARMDFEEASVLPKVAAGSGGRG